MRTHSSASSTFLQQGDTGAELTLEGSYGQGAHLIHFDLVGVWVIKGRQLDGRNSGLTQEQYFDRPGVLMCDFLPVDFLVDSVGPLLCLVLRPYPVLPLKLGFVGGRSEDVS